MQGSRLRFAVAAAGSWLVDLSPHDYICLLSATPLASPQARKDASEDASALVAREHAAALTDATTKLGAAQTALQTASDHVTALRVAERDARQQWQALHEARVAPGFAGRPAQERQQNAEQLNQLAEQIQQLRGQLEGARLAREQAQRVVDHACSYKLPCLGIHPPEPPPPAAEAAEAAQRGRAREGHERAEGLARRLWRQEMEDQMRRARAGLPAMAPIPPPGLFPKVPLPPMPWGWQAAPPPGAAPAGAGPPGAAPAGAGPPGVPPPGAGQQRQQQAAGQRQAAGQWQVAGQQQAAGLPGAPAPAPAVRPDALAAFAPLVARGVDRVERAAQGAQAAAARRRERQEDAQAAARAQAAAARRREREEDAQAAARARPRVRRRGDQDAQAAWAQAWQQQQQQQLHALLAQLAGRAGRGAGGGG